MTHRTSSPRTRLCVNCSSNCNCITECCQRYPEEEEALFILSKSADQPVTNNWALPSTPPCQTSALPVCFRKSLNLFSKPMMNILWWIFVAHQLHTSGTPVAHQWHTSGTPSVHQLPSSESISGLGNQTKLVTTMQLLPRGWTAIEEHSTLNHGGNWSAIYLLEYLMNLLPF